MSSIDLARVIVETLIGQGVREVVAAPGSRNAGLLIALSVAEKQGLIRLHMRVDERSAGFLALGLAKATAAPVAIVTTSGTAVGNLVPAVMEARHSGVPLVVVSADRPATMMNTGANQTTWQPGLFAPHVLDTIRMASSDAHPSAWRHAVRRGVILARGLRTRQPGPVHLNVELDTPLVDPQLTDPLEPTTELVVAAAERAAPWMAPALPETLVLVGDVSPSVGEEARALAESAGWPLASEPSGNARCGDNAIAAYRLLLDDFGSEIKQVICFGHPTLSRPVTRLLSRPEVQIVVVSQHAEWIDPGHRVDRVVDAVEAPWIQDREWLERWKRRDAEVASELDHVEAPADGRLHPRQVHQTLWASLGSDDIVMLGSSQPIRDADLASISAHPPQVFAHRGLAGIDGTVASASGIALGCDRPVTVVVGDLTLIHDLGSLVHGELESLPALRIIVLDDHGGSIFHGLEQGGPDYGEYFERVFATPQRLDLAEALRGLGIPATMINSCEELRRVLTRACRGIEAHVLPVSRSMR